MTKNYCVSSGDGTTCRMGLGLEAARRLARDLADDHDEPYFVAAEGSGEDGERFEPTEREIANEKIFRLRDEAGAAGDLAQVALCDRALAGDRGARRECAHAIWDAENQE